MRKMVIDLKKEVIIILAIFGLIVIAAAMLVFSLDPIHLVPEKESNVIEQTSSSQIPQSRDVAGGYSYALVLNTSVSNVNDKILVYKTVPPNVTKDLTLLYAKKFGVEGDLRGETSVQSKNLTFFVTVTKKSGYVEYGNQDRPTEKMDSPDQLPSDSEAQQIAIKYLKERDLFPEGAELVSPPGHENAYSSDDNNVVTISHGQICVRFHRSLNGLKVKGANVEVDIGGHGDVIGYYANWRNYEPYKEYPLITVEDAFEKLKLNGVSVGMNEPDRVSIDNVYLAYHSDGGAYKEDYLPPVWVFEGQVIKNNQSIMDVYEIIPALKEVPTELITS